MAEVNKRKMIIVINAEDKFSGTFEKLHNGIESTALTKLAKLRTGFEKLMDATNNRYNFGTTGSQGNKTGNGTYNYKEVLASVTQNNVTQATFAQGNGLPEIPAFANPVMSGVEKVTAHGAKTSEMMKRTSELAGGEQAQTELQQKAEHNSALFALEQEHKRRMLELDKMTWNMKFKTASTATSTMSNLMQNLNVATGSKNKAMFEAGKGFAIAETVINTYAAAMGAYKSQASIPFVGPALGVAAAGAALAAGAAQVREIRSTRPGGGSISSRGVANPSYAGGSISALPVPMRLAEKDKKITQHITVNIHTLEGTDVNWERIAEDNIKPALEALKDRNVRLDILTT